MKPEALRALESTVPRAEGFRRGETLQQVDSKRHRLLGEYDDASVSP